MLYIVQYFRGHIVTAAYIDIRKRNGVSLKWNLKMMLKQSLQKWLRN